MRGVTLALQNLHWDELCFVMMVQCLWDTDPLSTLPMVCSIHTGVIRLHSHCPVHRNQGTSAGHTDNRSAATELSLVSWRGSAALTAERPHPSALHRDFGCIMGERLRPSRWEKRACRAPFSICPYRLKHWASVHPP